MAFQSREASGMPAGSNQEASPSQPLLTVREVARLLAVHPNSVRRWVKQGRIKAYRVGRRGDLRFRLDDVDGFLT